MEVAMNGDDGGGNGNGNGNDDSDDEAVDRLLAKANWHDSKDEKKRVESEGLRQ